MADAYGKLTGRPAAAMVTRGPGACHGAIGVHVAFQDSTPMLLFVGQIAHQDTGRDAFQEVDYRQMFAPLAKWVTQIDYAKRIPEVLAHAESSKFGRTSGRLFRPGTRCMRQPVSGWPFPSRRPARWAPRMPHAVSMSVPPLG